MCLKQNNCWDVGRKGKLQFPKFWEFSKHIRNSKSYIIYLISLAFMTRALEFSCLISSRVRVHSKSGSSEKTAD